MEKLYRELTMCIIMLFRELILYSCILNHFCGWFSFFLKNKTEISEAVISA